MKDQRRRVAVIGAGAAGLPTARYLTLEGCDVTVFERLHVPGGVWNYDARLPPRPQVPSIDPRAVDPPATLPNVSEYPSRLMYSSESIESLPGAVLPSVDTPPGPCYESLHNNVPTSIVRYKELEWPPGTNWFVRHEVVAAYLHTYAERYGIDRVTRFGTAVVNVFKQSEDSGGKWVITSRSVKYTNQESMIEARWNREEFDAVVVATGHFNVPKIPNYPGLAEWHDRFPDGIMHSMSYRTPEPFHGERVLVVGNGYSALDVLLGLGPTASQLYHSTRTPEPKSDTPTFRDHLISKLPPSLVHLPDIASFSQLPDGADSMRSGIVTFTDGTTVTGIDRIIFCTGYLFSHPFLQRPDNAGPEDGESVPNLHRDIFCISDPSLAFVGIGFLIATFSYFEFQAMAVARVFSGKAQLPPTEEMEEEWIRRTEARSKGRRLHYVGRKGELAEVASLVEWLNRDGKAFGAPLIEGHPPEFDQVRDRAIEVFIKEREGLQEE
ncbi:hypothetical protein DFJ73DRAFT_620521 [Zopfochytrium polystomum]|nr:hypothetical protein DFJ73DRAFT_620521 [Zopfochytrium polystomum]